MMDQPIVNDRATNIMEIGGLMADEDIDSEMPIRGMAEFKRRFMEICRRVRLSAG